MTYDTLQRFKNACVTFFETLKGKKFNLVEVLEFSSPADNLATLRLYLTWYSDIYGYIEIESHDCEFQVHGDEVTKLRLIDMYYYADEGRDGEPKNASKNMQMKHVMELLRK